MNYELVRLKIIELLWPNGAEPESNDDDFDLKDRLDMDSLDFIEAIFKIENEFQFKVDDDDIEKYQLQNFRNLLQFVLEKTT